MARRTYSAEEREQFAEKRREELEKAHEQIAAKAAEIADGPQWTEWLRVASKFHRYSFNNTMLILLQRPDATLVAGYNAWRDTFKRQVTKGETGIRIMAPITRRTDKTDAEGKPVLDENGKPVKSVQLVGTKLVSVFDVSQTTGEPLPEMPQPKLLQGEAPEGMWDKLAAQVEKQGFTLERGDCQGSNGYTNFKTRTVRVRDDVDDAQAVKTLAHELGHVLLHSPSANPDRYECRGRIEVEAESVAYLVTQAHGLDSAQYTFTYVAGWAAAAATPDKSVAEVVAETGTRVVKAAHGILENTMADSDVMVSAQARTTVAELTHETHASNLLARVQQLSSITPVQTSQRALDYNDPPAARTVSRGSARGL